MLTNMPEVNSIGGVGGWGVPGASFGGGFGNGFSMLGLVGLLGINDLGRRHGDGDGCAKEVAVLAAIANAKDTTVAEGRGLAAAICDAEKTNLQQFYAQAIQAERNTQQLSAQAQAIAAIADSRFDALAAAGVQQTASILARINQAEVDQLRDQLHMARRHGDAKDLEITMIQNQNQQQQQQQAANFEIHRKFDAIFSQQAKAGQDIIAVGSLLAGTTQTANPVNVKS